MRTVMTYSRVSVRIGLGAIVLSVTPLLHGEQQRANQPLPAQRLVGAWRLETRNVRRADGTIVRDAVLGEKPLGRLLYDASGVMMLQMMRQGRAAAIGAPSDPR